MTLSPAALTFAPKLATAAPSAATPSASIASAAPPSAPSGIAATLDIIPPSCAALRLGELGASQSASPNQALVMAWPYVRLDEAAVQRVLDGMSGAGGGSDALVRAAVDSASQRASAAIAVAPNFIASGWMADSSTSASRGTLWVAFAWPTSVSATAAKNFALRVLSGLTGLPIVQAGSASEGFGATSPMGAGGIPKTADDKSDKALQEAAVRSASATVGFISAFGTALLGVGPIARARAATQTTRTFNDALGKLDAALGVLASLPTLVGQASAIAGAVAAATPETCRAAVAPADAAVAALNRAKVSLTNIGDAPAAIMQYVRTETNPDASDFIRQIRDQVVAQVDASMPAGTQLAVTKEYMKCLVWQNAKASLDFQVRSMASRLQDAANKAASISTMGAQISDGVAQINAAIAVLVQAKEQSCLSWFEKDWAGVPRMYWIGGGVASTLVVAVGVKAIRKKRAAAKAKLAPNARRTSRRTS